MVWRCTKWLLLAGAALCFGKDDSTRWALQGVSLTPAEAQKYEASLAGKPNDFRKRVELLGYYRAREWSQPEAVAARQPHLLWLIEREPESDVWLEDAAQEPDPAVYESVRDRWLAELAAHPKRTKRVRNAAAFLIVRDRKKALELLSGLDATIEGVEGLQAKADALTMLDIGELDRYGLPVTRTLPAEFAPLARAQESSSPERQCATAQALLFYGASLLRGDAASRGGLLDLVNGFFATGISLGEWSPSCTSGRETVAAWRNLQSAGWLPTREERDTGAKLAISKDLLNPRRVFTVPPAYPEFARTRHITGAVLCRVRISKEGNVIAAEPLSGARELAESAVTAIQSWKFTVPAEIVTILELRYTMQ